MGEVLRAVYRQLLREARKIDLDTPALKVLLYVHSSFRDMSVMAPPVAPPGSADRAEIDALLGLTRESSATALATEQNSGPTPDEIIPSLSSDKHLEDVIAQFLGTYVFYHPLLRQENDATIPTLHSLVRQAFDRDLRQPDDTLSTPLDRSFLCLRILNALQSAPDPAEGEEALPLDTESHQPELRWGHPSN